MFVRSPVRFDGVDASEDDWQRYEAEWLEAEARRARDAASETPCAPDDSSGSPAAADEAAVRSPSPGGAGETADLSAADLRPRFLSESYWLDFEFEPGNYYFAGRERLAGRDVLRIEYFPERLFQERGPESARWAMRRFKSPSGVRLPASDYGRPTEASNGLKYGFL